MDKCSKAATASAMEFLILIEVFTFARSVGSGFDTIFTDETRNFCLRLERRVIELE